MWDERASNCVVSRGMSYVCAGGCVGEVYLGEEREELQFSVVYNPNPLVTLLLI